MKKGQLIINIVLFIAIAILYVLHFVCNSNQTCRNQNIALSSLANGSIVYVNIDSLLNNFDMYFDMKKTLESKQKAMEDDFNSKTINYQKGVNDYQNKAQKGLITRSQAQEMEQQLMAEQQNLMKLRDKLTNDLSEETTVANRQMMKEIEDYLKEYNKDGKFQYILSYNFGGSLLYTPDSLNITSDVLQGLNARYKENADKKK